MPTPVASLHGAHLQRWMEGLCRLRWFSLREVVESTRDGCRVRRDIDNRGGIYCFWWTGSGATLRTAACGRQIVLHGPGGRGVSVQLDEAWLGIDAGAPVPLYVGKTTSGLRSRLVQHLMLHRPRLLAPDRGEKKAARPTTSCQLRAGVEDLFPGDEDSRDRVLDNVGLSFIELHGDDHAANRFYLEDLAVGQFRPPLNLDIER